MTSPNPYDTVPYPSYCHGQTHPGRLAALATLFGLTPAPVNAARVLELGCGDGGNLIPMAHALPGSDFTGIDLASDPVRRGQEMIAELGLRNVRLVAASVAAVTPNWGQFDYVIAHGLYSWVPAEIREHILRIGRENLAPHGVAFVSYNALPGGHGRQMLRDLLLFHTRQIQDSQERARQAQGFLQFVVHALAEQSDEYRRLLRADAESALELEPGHIFHDDLAEINESFWFSEFMSAARRHDLQFLAETDFFEMTDKPFNANTRAVLARIPDRLLQEQYRDFLKCRRFRQTLLCHAEANIVCEPDSTALHKLWVASDARPESPEPRLEPDTSVRFEGGRMARLETDFAAGKAALVILASIWPRPLPFAELCETISRRLAASGVTGEFTEETPQALGRFLLEAYGAGLVELHTHAPPCAERAGGRPQASPVALWQLRRGKRVTTLRHLTLSVDDEPARFLLALLDGTRDRSQLVEAMCGFLRQRNTFPKPDEEEAVARQRVTIEVDRHLNNLARVGLLVAKQSAEDCQVAGGVPRDEPMAGLRDS